MGALGLFIAIVICGMIVSLSNWWDNKKNKKKQMHEVALNQDIAARQIINDSLEKSKTDMVETKRTRDLFLETLAKIGCQYEIDEDGQIRFMWQGGHFAADAHNDCAFVVVWYLYWAEYELYDIDTLARVKRVINDANISYNINVMYSVDEAGSTFHVHSKKQFTLVPQMPCIEEYLQTILGMFFQVRHYIESELEKKKNGEERVAQ